MLTINSPVRAGLIAMIVGCGALAVTASAEARTTEKVSFAFAYDSQSLATSQGRAELEQRLDRETAKHCRNDYGARSSVATIRDCQRDLVKAVRFALVRGVEGANRKCIAVAMTPTAMRTDACDAI